MNQSALRSLEFDRIISVLSGLAVTPIGQDRLAGLRPQTDVAAVAAAQRTTTEGTTFLAHHPGFPLRAPSDLEELLDALGVKGRALEPLRLVALSDFLESIDHSRTAVTKLDAGFPILRSLVETVASFKNEITDVRRKIDPSGDVADNASPALASLRERLRKQRARLRSTLDGFVRGRETSKYLQDQVVTDRNGRYVLMVRAEHRSAIPGIVHGGSTSGASLFVEPLETVEINNDIVELDEQEAEEVRRILLALTDAFRARPDDLSRTVDVATELDVIQARARLSLMVDGVEPVLAADGSFELRGARHPLLMQRIRDRLDQEVGRATPPHRAGAMGTPGSGPPGEPDRARPTTSPVTVDILMVPPVRVLLITGPNTGGKTVALKTAGLFALMAQAGLHIPAEKGSKLPVFRSLFADIGDEQSISASLSTFSAHISNLVSMDRHLSLPALVLIDEVGAGTDPVEGGALGTAVIDHFRQRGAHVVATTHYDSLKSYASTTDGVVSAAFGFNAEDFGPTYRLVYGSPGRSLAIEIAKRLGMPASVIAAARQNLTDDQKKLADHLTRIDQDLRSLEQERRAVASERASVGESERKVRAREDTLRQREESARQKFNTKLDDHVREARKEIDLVIEGLKTRAADLSEQAARRAVVRINTGDAGSVRAEARSAIDDVVHRLKDATDALPAGVPLPTDAGLEPLAPGVKVSVGALGLEGIVIEVHGKHAEIDVRGKRLRAALRDLRVIGMPPSAGRVSVHVALQPREGLLSELHVIGSTVDEALSRLEKFMDESTVTDLREVRIVHGHGTGQLRRAIAEFLKNHPLVERYEAAPQNQGGGGATIAYLKD